MRRTQKIRDRLIRCLTRDTWSRDRRHVWPTTVEGRACRRALALLHAGLHLLRLSRTCVLCLPEAAAKAFAVLYFKGIRPSPLDHPGVLLSSLVSVILHFDFEVVSYSCAAPARRQGVERGAQFTDLRRDSPNLVFHQPWPPGKVGRRNHRLIRLLHGERPGAHERRDSFRAANLGLRLSHSSGGRGRLRFIRHRQLPPAGRDPDRVPRSQSQCRFRREGTRE